MSDLVGNPEDRLDRDIDHIHTPELSTLKKCEKRRLDFMGAEPESSLGAHMALLVSSLVSS